MKVPRGEVALQVQGQGVKFKKKKWFRLWFTETHKTVSADEFVEALDEGKEVAVQLGRSALMPVTKESDLRELGVFRAGLDVSELEQPSVGRSLQQLEKLGYEFGAHLGATMVPGLYGAYNALTDPDLGFSQAEARLGEARVDLRSSASLAVMAKFYADPKNEDLVSVERKGFNYFNADGQAIPVNQVDKNSLVGRADLKIPLTELPAGKTLEWLERFNGYCEQLYQKNGISLLQSVRDSQTPQEFADKVKGEHRRLSGAQAEIMGDLALEHLATGFSHPSEGMEWARQFSKRVPQGDHREKIQEYFLARPLATPIELAEQVVLEHAWVAPERLAETLVQKAEYSSALLRGQRLAQGREYADKILVRALEHRGAKTAMDLAGMAADIHEVVRGRQDGLEVSRMMLEDLAQQAQTENASKFGLDLLDAFPNQSIQRAIYDVVFKMPATGSPKEWSQAAGEVLEHLNGYSQAEEQAAVSSYFLDQLEKQPETAAAARFGKKMFEQAGSRQQKKDLMDWLLEHPEASTPQEFVGAAAAHSSLQKAALNVLTTYPESADLTSWAASLGDQLGGQALNALTRAVAEQVDREPDALVDRLISISKTDVDRADAHLLAKTAFDLLQLRDPVAPAVTMATAIAPQLKPYNALKVYQGLHVGLKAKAPAQLGRFAKGLLKEVNHEDQEALGRLALEHLSQFQETEEAARFGLELASQFVNDDSKVAVYGALLGNPALTSGLELATVGAEISGAMESWSSRNDKGKLGSHFLNLMAEDPQTRRVAEFGLSLVGEGTHSRDHAEVTDWSLNHPLAATEAEFGTFGESCSPANGRRLLTELAQRPGSEKMASWAVELGEKLSEEAEHDLVKVAAKDMTQAPLSLADRLMRIEARRHYESSDLGNLQLAAFDLMKTDPSRSAAAEFGLAVCAEASPYTASQALSLVHENMAASTVEELASLGSAIHQKFRGDYQVASSRRALTHLAAKSDAPPVVKWALDFGKSYESTKTQSALYGAALELPDMETGAGLATLLGSVAEGLGPYNSDARPLVTHLLQKMKVDPETRDCAEFCLGVLSEVEDSAAPTQLARWVCAHPKARRAEEFAGLTRGTRLALKEKVLERLADMPATAKLAGWTRALNAEVTRSTQEKISEFIADAPTAEPKFFAERLVKLSDDRQVDDDDHLPLLRAAVTSLKDDPDCSRVVNLGFEMAEGMEGYFLQRLLRGVYDHRKAGSLAGLAEWSDRIHKDLRDQDRVRAGEILLKSLKTPQADYGLKLAASFTEVGTRGEILKVMGHTRPMKSGVDYAALGHSLLSEVRSDQDSVALGKVFLEHLKEDPATEKAAEIAERLVLTSETDSRREFFYSLLLAHPEVKNGVELATAALERDVKTDCRETLLEELSRHPETEESATWARSLVGKLRWGPAAEVFQLALKEPRFDRQKVLDQILEVDTDRVEDRAALYGSGLELMRKDPLYKELMPWVDELAPRLDLHAQLAVEGAVIKHRRLEFPKLAREVLNSYSWAGQQRLIGEAAATRLAQDEPDFWELALGVAAGRSESEQASIYKAFLAYPSFDKLSQADPKNLGPAATEIVEVVQLAMSRLDDTREIDFGEDHVVVGDFELGIS